MTAAEIRAMIREEVARAVQTGTVANSSADGFEDELAGRSQPDEPSYQEAVRRLWPFGMRSRPPSGVECVVVRSGGAPGVLIAAESAKYGPADLEEGELAIYCITSGAVIKLDKDGKITIDAAAAKDVVVNGGSLKVARDTDPVNAGTLTGQAGPYPVVFTHVDAKTAAVTTGQSVTLTGKITDGAARFKG